MDMETDRKQSVGLNENQTKKSCSKKSLSRTSGLSLIRGATQMYSITTLHYITYSVAATERRATVLNLTTASV